MAVKISIDDDDVPGFSQPAKERLFQAAQQYVEAVIAETNRIEAGRNTGKGPQEITHGMVNDAVVVQRVRAGPSRSGPWSKILRVAAAVLALVAGIMYDTQMLQQRWYLTVYVFIIAGAILSTTVSVLKE